MKIANHLCAGRCFQCGCTNNKLWCRVTEFPDGTRELELIETDWTFQAALGLMPGHTKLVTCPDCRRQIFRN